MTGQSEKLRLILPIVGGLAIAGLTLFVFLGIAGGGHGWLSPWFNSAASLLLAPLGFTVAYNWKRMASWKTMSLLVIGLVLDGLLLIGTQLEGMEYFIRVGAGAYVWLALWLSWQLALGIALVSQSRHFRDLHTGPVGRR